MYESTLGTSCRVVVAVLDNFHFDLSSLQSPPKEEEGKEDVTAVHDDEQTPSDQSLNKDISSNDDVERNIEHEDGTPAELVMEDDGEDTHKDEETKAVGEDESLKQRATAQKIHKAIVNSILPSLEAVLTKRVSMYLYM